LLQAIELRLTGLPVVYRVSLSGESLGLLHKLYEMGEVLDRVSSSDGATTVRLRVPQARLADFRGTFRRAELASDG
jgi:hypothetical protein